MPWHMPSPPSPPDSASWPRGTAVRPPPRAPSWRALHRGRSTPQAGRAPGAMPHALSQQLRVLVARLRGIPGQLLRLLAIPPLQRPTILLPLPSLPQLLVKHPVQLPSARVRRAVDAAEVRRRQPLIAAHIADGVLLPLVVHV
eukprot:scaffold36844_cov58-Phaeocystis_antarctica.AAC.6